MPSRRLRKDVEMHGILHFAIGLSTSMVRHIL